MKVKSNQGSCASQMKRPIKPKRYRYPGHDGTVSTSELRRLPKAEKLEVMRVWFYDNYEDPVHNSPWIDGEFTYLHGGPYDARNELEGQFSGVISDMLMDELADELNSECDTWAGCKFWNYLAEFFWNYLADFLWKCLAVSSHGICTGYATKFLSLFPTMSCHS